MCLDAIIISDVHLGAYNCQAKSLTHFLDQINDGSMCTRRLIINGDLFDSFDSRLRKWNWHILSLIRKISDKVEVIWVQGNHDTTGPAGVVSQLIGADYCVKKYIFESGDKRIMVAHGDAYDKFLTDHPFLVWLGDIAYSFLQWMDRSCYLAKIAKSRSKMYIHCMDNVEQQALKHAKKHKCDIVCCGHVHCASIKHVDDVVYLNSGCWTENPCHYITIKNGVPELKEFIADE